MIRTLLDLAAELCLLFNVDWDTDFEDDEFVEEHRAAYSNDNLLHELFN